MQRGYIRQNPFRGNRKNLFIAEAEPVLSILEAKEFEKLIVACPDDRWRGICTVGYYAGLRLGEIANLAWKDLDFKERLLHVDNKEDHRTKSRTNRVIPMSGADVGGPFGYVYHDETLRYGPG